MTAKIDLTGQRFGRLTVLSENGRTAWASTLWLCVCDCGTRKSVDGGALRRGLAKSCGCLKRETAADSARKLNPGSHGKCGTTLYRRWAAMIQRCENPNSTKYADYGGRGISVYPEWRADFEAFEAYVSALPRYGEPGMELDRINNDLGYAPGNVRWVTRSANTRNMRTNHMVEFRGKARCIAEWSELLCLNQRSVLTRLRRGWTSERALTTGADPVALARFYAETSGYDEAR